MKDLSIEEKAKAYDGLIERLEDLKFAYRFSPLSDTIEDIFPELKESEDERIRKWIVKQIKTYDPSNIKDKALAWLEKQGEQKVSYTTLVETGDGGINALVTRELPTDGEQKPTWSEEDEKFFKTALWHISYSISNGKCTDSHCDITDWLKSLRSQSQWEPSKEQMNALSKAIAFVFNSNSDVKHSLESLYNELKKL